MKKNARETKGAQRNKVFKDVYKSEGEKFNFKTYLFNGVECNSNNNNNNNDYSFWCYQNSIKDDRSVIPPIIIISFPFFLIYAPLYEKP